MGGRFLGSYTVQGKLGKARGQSQSPRCPSEESQGWACLKSWPRTASAWEQPTARSCKQERVQSRAPGALSPYSWKSEGHVLREPQTGTFPPTRKGRTVTQPAPHPLPLPQNPFWRASKSLTLLTNTPKSGDMHTE